ncbi:uncharacterized protein AC631_02345 [Debaryomyces fabryi]|uniref:Flavin reductase like domain-containing protein n=1 Tax=Debaryomyces fabryi TaxID=58627 RepID=A0A0V1Q058_9ASCO|nr:uncharacterized protein AC631_02345 [Debaryomyces fabryi]KSA01889.1 hypothetical protein AC631_02345 [Debaryomyces fabryi]CUM53531.1 unnamed protein product [Debaryomyces fabryi]
MTVQPERFGLESQVKRNPHPDFNKVENERAPFEKETKWKFTRIPDKDWTPGSGANDDSWKDHKKIQIDPFAEDRNPVDNYKTLISAIVPRPIGFVSTIGADGTRNLAPFSYFTVVNHDPPIFTIGFSGGRGNAKDTCRNVLDTKELTINIISEWFVEAANFCSTNAPLNVDEWKLSGLTPLESTKVKPQHVAESAFSIEAKLLHSHEWTSKRDENKVTGTLCIVEGVNFHVRDDVINDQLNILDIDKLKPVSRLGGITYGRTVSGYEKLRPDFDKESETDEVKKILNGN